MRSDSTHTKTPNTHSDKTKINPARGTRFRFSVKSGELVWLDGRRYVTHTGLVRLAHREKCHGIQVEAVNSLCDLPSGRFVFKATVYPSKDSPGFVGYGDADPSNVSFLVRGAEMRVAETRAVNRALRKAYGIGLCSVEEIGSVPRSSEPDQHSGEISTQHINGNGLRSGCGPRVRDRLCQLIRQHQLDPDLVKAYAVDFCGARTLKEATRAQVERFVDHLADWAGKDRDALLCQLNSYPREQDQSGERAGAA
jgi:hypothetical protein